MPLSENVVRLRHMLEAAQEAVDFAGERSPQDLETDRQLTLSLIRSLEVDLPALIADLEAILN